MSTIHDTPFGSMTLRASNHGLTACSFDLAKDPTRPDASTALAERWRQIATRELDDYFAGDRKVDVMVDLRGLGEFEIRLYGALRTVEHGQTVEVDELTSLAGFGAAAGWLVTEAVRRNPVQILIPSHRVVDGRGVPVGAGRDENHVRALLDLEQHSARSSARRPHSPYLVAR